MEKEKNDVNHLGLRSDVGKGLGESVHGLRGERWIGPRFMPSQG